MSAVEQIPFTVVSNEMVTRARVAQGRQRLDRWGMRNAHLIDPVAAMAYSDTPDEIRQMLAAALEEPLS